MHPLPLTATAPLTASVTGSQTTTQLMRRINILETQMLAEVAGKDPIEDDDGSPAANSLPQPSPSDAVSSEHHTETEMGALREEMRRLRAVFVGTQGLFAINGEETLPVYTR